ncbi:sialate O-acetylesterase [Sphingomonas silueang]|uniref:sialate O-acetylesterase n=1 Tax=Sphingomonas silueang TaxID=3156617 RepID=UPI0032B3C86D
MGALHAMRAVVSAAALATGMSTLAQEPGTRFGNIFADHAVVQRDRPIALWGRGAPDSDVTVQLGDTRMVVRVGSDGNWRASLPPRPAGGPYTLSVTGRDGYQTLGDIMVGDVFLCGGQSNMEFKVSASTNAWGNVRSSDDPDLRFVVIDDANRPTVAKDLDARAKWARVSPETVGDASAVCYYMARELRKSEKVPIGFISSEWGGTRIESWISAPSLTTLPHYRDGVAAVAQYARDPVAAVRADGERREAWWRANDPAAAAQVAWRTENFDDRAWPTIRDTGWRTAGIADLAEFQGAMWLRTTIDLTAEQAAAATALRLGPIDEFDESYVNGSYVGGGSVGWAWRRYPLTPGRLHAGRNVVAIRVLGGANGGGFTSPAPRGVELADGSVVPFGGTWRYAKGTAMTGKTIAPPPWDTPNSLTTLYNGMIAPFAGYGLKLAAWYQGEANATEAAEYRTLLPLLMADWRRTFANPTLPFFLVQLTSWKTAMTVPGQSGWAELRQAQAESVAADAHAGLAVTLDVGDRFDIHPTQKTVVGERLARLAKVIAYGHPGLRSGPEAVAVTRQGGDLVVRYRNVTGGLHGYSANQAIGFETCVGETCSYAPAVPQGDAVLLTGANRPGVTRVRYAWADAPFVNLFDGADLPAAPFVLPVR